MLMQNNWDKEGVLCETCERGMSRIGGLFSFLAILIRIIKRYGSVIPSWLYLFSVGG